MATQEDFAALPTQENCDSDALTISMDTEINQPSPEDQPGLTLIRIGALRKNQEQYDSLMKEAEDLTTEIEGIKDELTLLGTCPVINCQHHTKLNSPKMIKRIDDCTKQLETKLANTHLTTTINDGNSTENASNRTTTKSDLSRQRKLQKSRKFCKITPSVRLHPSIRLINFKFSLEATR
ncbi:hypothetical protein TNCV_2478681 [Trichonephila clavipes]|nr:hypothetical protein TNCV_2478681 [Trichonephila clavipes]